ncbi:MAG: Phage integrase family [Pseudomonadota bacterium]
MDELRIGEFYALYLLSKKVSILKYGSQNSRWQHLKVLLLLLKDNSGLPVSKLINYGDDIDALAKKCRTYFQTAETQRGIDKIKLITTNPLYEAQVNKIKDTVEEFYSYMLEDPQYDFYLNTELRKKDQLKQRYLTANIEEVYCTDTTTLREDCHVTSLMDLGSRLTVSVVITRKKPNANDIIDLFNKVFYKRDGRKALKIQIIHADQAGPNTAKIVIEYCEKRGIILSYPNPAFKFANQVIENWNRILKALVQKARFEVDKTILFEELAFEEQVKIIKFVVEFYNHQESKSQALPKGSTPKTLHESKAAVKCLALVIGAPKTPEGNFITKFNEMVFARYELLQAQLYASEKNPNVPLLSSVSKNAIVPYKRDQKALNRIDAKTLKYRSLKEIYDEMSLVPASDPDGIQQLIDIVKANKNLFTPGEYLGINITLKAAAKQSKEMGEVKEEIAEMREENKKIKSALAKTILALKKTTDKLTIFEEKEAERARIVLVNEEKKLKRKLSKTKKVKAKYAIYPEHFDFIFQNIKHRRKLQRARSRVAHTLLRIYAIRISNLRTVTVDQLKNLRDNKTVSLLPIKSRSEEKMVFPFVPSIRKYIKPIKDDLDYLIEEGEKNREIFDFELEESEIWSLKLISREELTKTFNQQLKLASLKYKARFTSHSYRRGLATVIAHLSGLEAARKYLNHTNIGTTQRYVIENNIIPKLKVTMRSALNLGSMNELPKLSYDNQILKDTETAVNALLNEEQADNLDAMETDQEED